MKAVAPSSQKTTRMGRTNPNSNTANLLKVLMVAWSFGRIATVLITVVEDAQHVRVQCIVAAALSTYAQ